MRRLLSYQANSGAVMGGSPAEILSYVNDKLCSRNELSMFVTVWFGIMEISTGRIVAANAGHEYPIIKTNSGGFKLYNDGKHGPMVGIVEGARLHLDKGDVLYLYTDGVAEAENAQHEQFGTDRAIAALDSAGDASPEKLIGSVADAIQDFVMDAPQFDDTTMLCVKRLK